MNVWKADNKVKRFVHFVDMKINRDDNNTR